MTDKAAGEISKAHTDNDYRIYAAESKIRGFKAQIRKLTKKQQSLTEQISNSVVMIDELEAKKKLQTESEREETEINISKISSEAEQLQAELEATTIEIAELKEKVKIQKEIVRGGGGS